MRLITLSHKNLIQFTPHENLKKHPFPTRTTALRLEGEER